MAGIELDMSELDEFSTDLANVPQELSRHLLPTMKKAAQNIKENLQEDFRASSHRGFQAIAGKVSYDDISEGSSGYETEIGIDKEGAGKLGVEAVFGTYKGGGTHKHPSYYAQQEMPNFEQHVASEIERLFS